MRWGDDLQRESDMVDYDDFYTRLKNSSEPPTTSQPSVGDFVAAYEPLLAAGRDIVSIHLSSGLSGTYGAAVQAKALLDERGAGGADRRDRHRERVRRTRLPRPRRGGREPPRARTSTRSRPASPRPAGT